MTHILLPLMATVPGGFAAGIPAAIAASGTSGAQHTALLVLVLLAIGGIVTLVSIRILSQRIRQTIARSTDLNSMMSQALSMDQFYILEYDLKTGRISNQYGSKLPTAGYSIAQLAERIAPEHLKQLQATIGRMVSGQLEQSEISLKWRSIAAPDAAPRWLHVKGNITLERDADGTPHYIVGALKDETQKMEQEFSDRDLGNRFKMIFDTNIVAMSFYGSDGTLIDVNHNMKTLCGFDKMGEQYFRTQNLFDVPLIRDDFDPDSHDYFHVCQHMHYPAIGIEKYVELRIRPTFDDDDRLVYYIVTGRDITDERTMYLQQQRYDHELQMANASIGQYEQQLRYLLEKSDMYVWHSDTAKKTISFSRSLKAGEHTITFQEYIDCMEPDHARQSEVVLDSPDKFDKSFNVIHRFRRSPLGNTPKWFAISGTPIKDASGHVTGYFGILRNVSKLMDAQERLKQETARAENSGKLKSVFLANMTHEIRTPLNAIVGFSDLLPMIDTDHEKREFIRIIRNNCDMLLRLINDILEASNLSSRPLDIAPKDIDFAQAFNDICQTLAQRVQEPGVEFISDNPYASLQTHLDQGRMQQVYTNFLTNAVKYTHQGHIRIGYRVTGPAATATNMPGGSAAGAMPPPAISGIASTLPSEPGILMYCEDTGDGIPLDKQAMVFERFVKLNDFVQGTGLGLSICKSIAKRCNGKIGVNSEGEGNGSTFWFWIPCPIYSAQPAQ